MAKSNLPAPSGAPNGTTPGSIPTPIIITTAAKTRTVYRSLDPKDRRIELGGGAMFPKIKCSRKDLGLGVLAIGGAALLVYAAKGCVDWLKDYLKERKEKREKKKSTVPPSIQPLASCVSTSSGPKPAIIPNLLYQGGTLILGGRTGIGKSLLIGQFAIEIARGHGEFIPPTADGSCTPRHVIIIDGEMEDDDYVARFPDPSTIPGNITRVSNCDFETAEDLTEFIKGVVSGLVSEAVIIIDNIVSLIKNPTGSDIFDMFRNLRKIQHEANVPISYIVANHLAKVPEGMSMDESFFAGSANITRFASSIAILDKSARGRDFRFLKVLKERKYGVPAEVIELEYSEDVYKHYNFFGTAPEDEVLYSKTNRRRFGQEVPDEEHEEEEEPKPDGRGEPWTEEDDRQLTELFNTHANPTPALFAELMEKKQGTVYKHGIKLGFEWKKQKSGPKPKQKSAENQEQE